MKSPTIINENTNIDINDEIMGFSFKVGMALAALAGDLVHALALSLPAATTIVMPCETAELTALSNAVLAPPPKLILATAGLM